MSEHPSRPTHPRVVLWFEGFVLPIHTVVAVSTPSLRLSVRTSTSRHRSRSASCYSPRTASMTKSSDLISIRSSCCSAARRRSISRSWSSQTAASLQIIGVDCHAARTGMLARMREGLKHEPLSAVMPTLEGVIAHRYHDVPCWWGLRHGLILLSHFAVKPRRQRPTSFLS